MIPAPNAIGLALAAVITVVAVGLSAYWQPDAPTPLTVQAAIVFLAAALTLARVRRFRRH